MSPELLKRSRQVIVIGLMMVALGYLSDRPTYRIMEPSQTELRLIIRHSGVLIGACEVKTPDELKSLAPNMRQPMTCPREKSPLSFELWVDGEILHQSVVKPSGIHDDGVLALYRSFRLAAGKKEIELKVKDQAELAEFNLRLKQTLDLSRDSVVLVELTDKGIQFSQPGSKSGA
ncbi:MAG: hypothetical protein HOC70_12620 [Gammaproteobacteria bacterium]|nr:hypothetical protein [Gammaproteobacteria bacterium]MBT4494078.1 hypothetical protein [Gammaproteobacteria bacterium]MBT7370484.1 hypothetical protein [Gammaproteobacteria bacterium]